MYVVIDFETTGLNYLDEQIVEVGAVRLNSKLEPVGTLHTMVRLTEGRNLPEFITNLTGIKQEDLLYGVSETVALNMLKDFIGKSIVIAHHAPFDLSFLASAVEPEFFIDTRAMSQLLHPEEKAGLKDVAERYGIEFKHHRSLSDVHATIDAFKHMKAEAEQRGLPYTNLVFSTEERPLKFIPLSAIVVDFNKYKEQQGEQEEQEKESEK